MTEPLRTFAPSDESSLVLLTDVTGRASKMGHRLAIVVREWRAEVDWVAGRPVQVVLTAVVESLEVVEGDGGITPLLGPEKALARSNALKTLDADKYPRIEFCARTVDPKERGYSIIGTAEIHGTRRAHVVDLSVEDLGTSWRLTSETVVRQSDYGIKPYSQLMGAMKVVDDVTISFTAECRKLG